MLSGYIVIVVTDITTVFHCVIDGRAKFFVCVAVKGEGLEVVNSLA
jgi:hypothetical protein